MTWVKLDDQWADHPKFLKVGDFAQLMWVKGLTYSARYLLDGSLPDEMVGRLVSVRAWKLVAQKLVDAGLWEKVDGGYLIHDYQKYQPLREAVLAERALAALRMKRGRSGPRSPEHTPNERPNERRSSPEVRLPRPDPVPDPDLTSTVGVALGKPDAPDPELAHNPRSETKLRVAPEETPEAVEPDQPATTETGYDLARRVWCELWQAKYRRAYEFNSRTGPGSEDYVLKSIGERALIRQGGAEAYLRHKISAYLKDHGRNGWLDEHTHPLKTIENDWVAYGEPTRRLVPRRAKLEDSPPPPMSTEEQRARAMALVSGIGKGGG